MDAINARSASPSFRDGAREGEERKFGSDIQVMLAGNSDFVIY